MAHIEKNIAIENRILLGKFLLFINIYILTKSDMTIDGTCE
jgi:hypothetical protein